jgi:hypothetical protein
LQTGFQRETTPDPAGVVQVPLVDAITVFGLITVASMLVSYVLKPGRAVFFIAFAVSWVLGSAYMFYAGAWPLGVIQAIFAAIAFSRWRKCRRRR